MKFTKELPVWLAPGIKPPESLTAMVGKLHKTTS